MNNAIPHLRRLDPHCGRIPLYGNFHVWSVFIIIIIAMIIVGILPSSMMSATSIRGSNRKESTSLLLDINFIPLSDPCPRRRGVKYLAKTLSVLKTQSVLVKTQSVLVKTQCVFKSVFIFPINLRIAQKYFGDATYLRTIFQIRGFLCLPVDTQAVPYCCEPR